MNNKKKCFVIMPFSATRSCSEGKWTEIFEYIIKPAVEESGLGYQCERSVAERENIIKGILEALNKANVVIADLTDNNPNVFYELGVRHTLANRTLLIAQGKKHIPFDLRPYPVAFYSESPAEIAEFKKDIKKKLEDIEADPDKPDSPVADFLKERNIELLSHDKKENLKKLAALISELSYNMKTADSILALVKNNEQVRQQGKGSLSFSNARFSNTCLDLLLSTSYIIFPQNWQKVIRGINDSIKFFNIILESWTNKAFENIVEEKLKDELLGYKDILIEFTKIIATIRTKYANDNYQEPEAPVILLASPEHEEYLKLTK